jgi:hypothetical protein
MVRAFDDRHAMNRRMEVVQSAWTGIRACLEREKQQVYEEIRTYPRPIPACDQQFNALLEERARLARELERLDAACAESLTRGDPFGLIEAFITSSGYIDADAARRIRSGLREGLAGPQT